MVLGKMLGKRPGQNKLVKQLEEGLGLRMQKHLETNSCWGFKHPKNGGFREFPRRIKRGFLLPAVGSMVRPKRDMMSDM